MFTKIIEKEVKVVDETKIKELEEQIFYLKRDLSVKEKDFESQERILKNELQLKINESTSEKEKENNNLRERNAVLTEKVSILEKAFENMGFDVKDMKDILNKLVDGLVSKNEINVIK